MNVFSYLRFEAQSLAAQREKSSKSFVDYKSSYKYYFMKVLTLENFVKKYHFSLVSDKCL